MTATVTYPAKTMPTDSQALLAIHVEAAEVASVRSIGWRHAVIVVTAATHEDADALSVHLLGNNHRTGTWLTFDLTHHDRPSRHITLVIEEPGQVTA